MLRTPFKFVVLGDVHLGQPGSKLYGRDVVPALRGIVDDISINHPDAGFCLTTGDLILAPSDEREAAFRFLLAELDRLPMTVHHVLGNHDERATFNSVMASLGRPMPNDFHQYTVPAGTGTLITLDTHDHAERDGGLLSADRLSWLEDTLTRTEGDILLAMHHPAWPIGMPLFDAIALDNPEDLDAVLSLHMSRIRGIFVGHIHRPLSGSWRGIPWFTLPSCNIQSPLELNRADRWLVAFTQPAYAVVLFDSETLAVHLTFCGDPGERIVVPA